MDMKEKGNGKKKNRRERAKKMNVIDKKRRN